MADPQLSDITSRLQEVNESSENTHNDNISYQKMNYALHTANGKMLNNIHDTMQKMFDLSKSEADEARRRAGFELELLRESARKSKDDKPDVTNNSVTENSSSWFDMLGKALLVGVAAYALGVDKYIRAVLLPQTLKMISKTWLFKKFFSSIGKLIAAPFKTATFTKAFAPVSTAWKNFTSGFKNVGKTMGAIKTPVAISEFKTASGKIGASIGKVLKPILEFFKTSKAFFSGGISKVGNFFKSIGGFFKSIGKIIPFGGRLLTLLKGVPVLGQVIAVVMGIFDFVTGFIDGFKKKGDDDERSTLERIWDGIKEGVIKAIKGILTIPLDLITKGVAYLLGFLGFDQVQEKILAWVNGDGGFTGMFDKMIATISEAVDSIMSWLKLLFTDPLGAIKALAVGYLTMLTDFGGWIYKKAIKPIVDWIGTLFGAKEGETSKSIETWVGDKLNKITNFAEEIYNKYIAPIVKWVSDLFGGGDEKGGAGGLKWPDLSGMMPDLPTWDNIKSKIGTLLNDMLQGLAKMTDLTLIPSGVSRAFAGMGVSTAAALGVAGVQKYNPSDDKMELVDTETGRITTQKELDAKTKAAADAKAAAAKPAAPVVINQTKVGGDTAVGGSRTQVGITPTAGGPKVPRG